MADKSWDNLLQFHQTEGTSLFSKYRQIELLLGLQHHPYTEGYYCEYLLREYLRRNIPLRLRVNTGFVKVNPLNSVKSKKNKKGTKLRATPQIDIIIHDVLDHSPLFQIEDMVIILPESLKAVIEVKKKLTSVNFKEALLNVVSSKKIISEQRSFSSEMTFFAIFSFDTPTFGSKSKTIANRLIAIAKKYEFKLLPDFIFCGNTYAIIKNVISNDKQCFSIYRTDINGTNISMQFFLEQMYIKLDLEETKDRVNRFSFPIKFKPILRGKLLFQIQCLLNHNHNNEKERINALKKRAWHEEKTKSGANKNYTIVAVNFKAANSRSMQAGIW